MTSIFLSRGLRIPRTFTSLSISLIRVPFAARAASLNSAIGRGLRRSKGVGFRGRVKTEDREGEPRYEGVVRRTAEPHPPAFSGKLTREAWKKDAANVLLKRGSSSGSTAFTIRRGKLKTRVDMDDGRPPKTRSRAARFHDPDSSFGKKSLSKKRAAEADLAFRVEEFEKGGTSGRYDRSDLDSQSRRPSRGFERGESKGLGAGRERRGFQRSDNPRRPSRGLDRGESRDPSAGREGRRFQVSDSSRRSSGESMKGGSKFSARRDEREFQGSDGPRGRGKSPFKSRTDDNKKAYLSSEERFSTQREARPHYGRSFTDSRRSEEDTANHFEERRARDFEPRSTYSSTQDRRPSFDRNGSRSESDTVNSHNRYTSSSETKQSQKTESADDPPPAQVRTTINRNIPLSIPYTTPASEFLYGTSVVSSALQSTRNPRRKLYKFYIYSGPNRENFTRDTTLEHLAKTVSIPIVKLTDPAALRMLDKMSAGRPHNGYILEASPLPRLPVQRLGALTYNETGHPTGFKVVLDHQSREEAAINGISDFIPLKLPLPPTQNQTHTKSLVKPRNPLILLLDSILDPGNLGSILRTASFLGVTALAISTHKSASFTPIVLKASAGASENITLFSVTKPANFITDSKKAGWKVYAGVAPSNEISRRRKMSTEDVVNEDPLVEGPCILMLGSEGEGLKWGLRAKADVDLEVRGSEGRGGTDSLNVSVAAGILCNSFLSRSIVGRREKAVEGEEQRMVVDEKREVGEVEQALF